MFSSVDSGEEGSQEVHFDGSAIKLSKLNVSKYVGGLRHSTNLLIVYTP